MSLRREEAEVSLLPGTDAPKKKKKDWKILHPMEGARCRLMTTLLPLQDRSDSTRRQCSQHRISAIPTPPSIANCPALVSTACRYHPPSSLSLSTIVNLRFVCSRSYYSTPAPNISISIDMSAIYQTQHLGLLDPA